MPKVLLLALGIPCIQGAGGQPHHAYGICLSTWHPLQFNSSGKQGYNHSCTALDGALRAARNTGADYYREPQGVVSSLPLAQT